MINVGPEVSSKLSEQERKLLRLASGLSQKKIDLLLQVIRSLSKEQVEKLPSSSKGFKKWRNQCLRTLERQSVEFVVRKENGKVCV